MSPRILGTLVCLVLSSLLLALVWSAAFVPSTAAAEKSKTVGVVLSNLPEHANAAYKALHGVAGRPSSEMLEMTKSEMWNVPGDHVEALIAAAAKQGVAVTVLDETWNHTLAPMRPDEAMSPEQEHMMHDAMQSKAAMGMSMMALPQSNVLEYALTKGMHAETSRQPEAVLMLPLTDKISVSARRTSIAKTPDGYVWHGVVTETGEPVTLLWWPAGRLSGQVTYKGHVYAVRNMGGGMHGVIEMSPNELPPEHAPMPGAPGKGSELKADPLVSKGDASMMRAPSDAPAAPTPAPERDRRSDTRDREDAPFARPAIAASRQAPQISTPKSKSHGAKDVVITVLVAYTKQAASHYGDIDKDLIQLAIEDANQSFRNSGIGNVRLELVHTYETDYVESGSHFEHVFRFADKGDGYMDDVHALRDRYAADVAVLVVHDPQGCGLAAQVKAPADRAFAVVHHECAANSYSLAHEIGHIIGARHDLALDNSVDPFPYGHGFVNGKLWRTMMSYKDSCDGCPRLPLWSNPRIKVGSVRAGDMMSNNARVIREGAARVAAFR